MKQIIGKPNWPWIRYKLRTYVCFVFGHPCEELGFKVSDPMDIAAGIPRTRMKRCLRCGELDPEGRTYFWNRRWTKE